MDDHKLSFKVFYFSISKRFKKFTFLFQIFDKFNAHKYREHKWDLIISFYQDYHDRTISFLQFLGTRWPYCHQL